MPGLRGVIKITTTEGDSITIGDTTVTPRSSVLVVRLPGGGFVWNRPIGVTVRRGDAIQEIPIRDVTRIPQLALAGATVLLLIASRLNRTTKKETR
jgi:hypothetical protein